MAAHPGFGALADFNFHSVSPAQVFRSDAVQIGHIFENIFFRRLSFLRQDSTLTAAHGRMGKRASLCQRHLGLLGQSAEGHMGYVHRIAQYQRLFGIRPNHRCGIHKSMLVQRKRIQLGPQEKDIIPARHAHPRPHRFYNRLSGHRHFMDLIHVADRAIHPPVFRGIR